jgi:hypothetical protein
MCKHGRKRNPWDQKVRKTIVASMQCKWSRNKKVFDEIPLEMASGGVQGSSAQWCENKIQN